MTPVLELLAAISLAAGPVRAQLPTDPAQGEVPLVAASDWRATLVFDQGSTGIWTVAAFDVFEQYAVPEVVALDDAGRCTVLVSYSGKWTPLPRIHDGAWLGGLAHGDVDPRVAAAELYTGGRNGNIYQLRAYRHGALDARLIAHLPGREVHTLVAGAFAAHGAPCLLAFTRPGGLFRLSPTGADGEFAVEHMLDLRGRVRDALSLNEAGADAPRLALAARDGTISELHLEGSEARFELLHREDVGIGRLARAGRDGPVTAFYAGLDDGRVLRLERNGDRWSARTIFAGEQGLRGIVSGRFHEDPERESLAIFGYSGKVHLLTREAEEQWTATTIFTDRDRGHWLSVAELDGRNGTDEILGSGYGGRVFLLARPPGFALEGAALAPSAGVGDGSTEGPPRVAVRAGGRGMRELSPLRYDGGFFPKTAIYETLVRRDAEGRIGPGLAESWTVSADGRTFRFTLRPDARYHDGREVDAASVRDHVRRWARLPEHAWLGASAHIRDVVAEAEDTLRIELDEPYALLADLCAINPCAVRGPGALDASGEFVAPIGSGPYRYVAAVGERTHRLQRVADGAFVDLVTFDAEDLDGPYSALLRGDIDLLVDGWYDNVPRERLAAWRDVAGIERCDGPGSSVHYLSFRLEGPTANADLRRAVAAAVDRDELVARVEHGAAEATYAWAAPSVRSWPPASAHAEGAPPPPAKLTLLARAESRRERETARVVAEQCARAGLSVDVELAAEESYAARLSAGSFDLRLECTFGVPYDPWISLHERFGPAGGSAESRTGVDPRLSELVAASSRIADDAARERSYVAIQALLDDEALIVPLFTPRRIALARIDRCRPLSLDHDIYRLPPWAE